LIQPWNQDVETPVSFEWLWSQTGTTLTTTPGEATDVYTWALTFAGDSVTIKMVSPDENPNMGSLWRGSETPAPGRR
jgi:hypothetical protein